MWYFAANDPKIMISTITSLSTLIATCYLPDGLILAWLTLERSLAPEALSSSSLNDSWLYKIYNEYKICNMQREGPASQAGFESMFIDWESPPPIPDRLSDVLSGWVWGFLFYMNKSLIHRGCGHSWIDLGWGRQKMNLWGQNVERTLPRHVCLL